MDWSKCVGKTASAAINYLKTPNFRYCSYSYAMRIDSTFDINTRITIPYAHHTTCNTNTHIHITHMSACISTPYVIPMLVWHTNGHEHWTWVRLSFSAKTMKKARVLSQRHVRTLSADPHAHIELNCEPWWNNTAHCTLHSYCTAAELANIHENKPIAANQIFDCSMAVMRIICSSS